MRPRLTLHLVQKIEQSSGALKEEETMSHHVAFVSGLIALICAPFVSASIASAGPTDNLTITVNGTVGVGQKMVIGGTVKDCQIGDGDTVVCYRNIDPLGGGSNHGSVDFLCLQSGSTDVEGFSQDSQSRKKEGETTFTGGVTCINQDIVVLSGKLRSSSQSAGAEIEDCVSLGPTGTSCIVSGDEMSYVAECASLVTGRPTSFTIMVTMDSDGSSFTRTVQCK